jgi:hypothetical protein
MKSKKRQIISAIVAVVLILGMIVPPVIIALNGVFR